VKKCAKEKWCDCNVVVMNSRPLQILHTCKICKGRSGLKKSARCALRYFNQYYFIYILHPLTLDLYAEPATMR